jgi:hypothetical protein
LEKCFDGEEICGNNMKWIYKKVFELILSCEIISFLLATIIFNHSSKLHLIHLFVIFSLIINKLILVILLFLIYNFKSPDFICDDWEKGLNNTSIDNNEEKYGCKIRIPKYCHYKVFSKYQDFTKLLGIDCTKKKLIQEKLF